MASDMRTSTRTALAIVAAAIVLLAACGGSGDGDGEAPESTPVFTLLPTTTSSTTTTSTTTTTTTSTTSTTTTTTIVVDTTAVVVDPAIDELVLSGEGIGTAGFGADADGVIDYIRSYFGAADNDTGWIDPLSIGLCEGDELRRVSWGVLTLQFSDVSNIVQGRRHFSAYTYGDQAEIGGAPVGLHTTRGIAIGSRVVDVRAAYPAATINPEDDFSPPFFYVNDSLRGFLTGVEDEATVTAILGGEDCGL